jgi:hypothetical protein
MVAVSPHRNTAYERYSPVIRRGGRFTQFSKTNPAAVSAAGARNLRVPRDVHPEADDDWLREVLALSAYERR